MKELKLRYSVYTPENKELLPAGTVISEDVMNSLIDSNKDMSYEKITVLQHGSVSKDITDFLSQPPYHIVFSDNRKVAEIMRLMESVHLIYPVIQSLDFFKYKDYYTYRHTLIVFALSTLLAIDLIPDYTEQLMKISSGPTHDFGKINVPIPILKKSIALTREELNLLMHHTVAGYVLLSYYLKDPYILPCHVARDHHERKDGSGYPRGINLNDFMVEIIAVSDVYDALISPRPYRPVSYDIRTACEEITAMAERGEISWEIAKAIIAHNRKSKPHYSECLISTEKRGKPPEKNVYGVIADEKNDDKL
jgi:HD-GYP domain-containing protein (c-di-GMP phosphodiesterase class II)